MSQNQDLSVTDLQNAILAAVTDPSYNLTNLLNLLSPIENYINNPDFISNLNTIVSILTEDRDGGTSFDIQDIVLLKNDLPSMISLVNSLLLLMAAVPNTSFQYSSSTTELLIFKVIAYILLVVIPNQTNTTITLDDKTTMISVAVSIYNILVSTSVVQSMVAKIQSWFSSGGCLACCCSSSSTSSTQDVVSAKLPVVTLALSARKKILSKK